MPDSLKILAQEINEINRANGWNVVSPDSWKDRYHIPSALALIHSEVSEALEAFRHTDHDNFAEELADTLIRVLDMAGGLGIDIDKEVRTKLEANKNRGFKHGGKRI
jgi:NTP pyrophosphatase (non-canonical NTP hydrolase)